MNPARSGLLHTVSAATLFLVLGTVAHAQSNPVYQPEVSGTIGKERTFFEHERPAINSTEGTTFGNNRTTVNGTSWNSDPVVATNRNGRLYDRRTGRLLSADQAADARERADAYEAPGGVTLAEWETGEGAVGLNAGPFEDGRVDILGGGDDDIGRVSVDVLRASGEGEASLKLGRDGLAAEGELRGELTLVSINGEVEQTWGDDMNNVTIAAEGEVTVGAEAELGGSATVNREGVAAAGSAGAHLGGRAEGEVSGGFTICGVNIGARGTGEVSYGIGAEAEGYFKVNWSTMTVKLGGKAAATFGLGAGVGGEVEVSLSELMKDPRAAANCTFEKLKAAGEFVIRTGAELANAAYEVGAAGVEKLGEAADVVGAAVTDATDWAGDRISDAGSAISSGARKLCLWCDDPEPPPTTPVAVAQNGYNGPRNAPTTVRSNGPADGNLGGGNGSRGVGISR